MGLKIMLLIGLAVVLTVGSCIADVLTGETNPEGDAPFTVALTESVCSFSERFTGTGGTDPDPDPGPAPTETVENNLIINENIDFAWAARSFEAVGPLVITYIIRGHDDTTFDSFMKVTVTDCATGKVLLQDGYRRQYSGDLEKDLKISHEGPVQIDLYGNRVNVDILVRTDL